jgi:small-conductance mechanosensitive channel
MDIQQAINLEIFQRFEQEDIQFAYPTQYLYIENPGNGSAAPEVVTQVRTTNSPNAFSDEGGASEDSSKEKHDEHPSN